MPDCRSRDRSICATAGRPTAAASPRLRIAATLLGSCILLGLAGCVQFVTPKPSPPDPAGRFSNLTQPVIFVGDTQEHETTGFPLHNNDGAVDAYVEVAQRPPEQPLFGRRILEWVLTTHAGEPVVHLGDLLDMSCKSEMRRMSALVAAAKQEGALLPGTHDGLMFGIFNAPLVGPAMQASGHAWYRGCVRGAEDPAATSSEDPRATVVDRREFIAAYLTLLGSGKHHPITGLPKVPETAPIRISWRNPVQGAFLEGIEANLRALDSYGNSFIAQKLRLPAAPGAKRRVVMIGLDTNQVGALVGSFDAMRGLSPGDIGHVRADQLEAIAPWLDEARREGAMVVFAGHHNWNRLSFSSQARLGVVMAGLDQPLVYLSAHTHRGFWAMHHLGSRSLLELNVSSLSDWPISYRRVTFASDESANRL